MKKTALRLFSAALAAMMLSSVVSLSVCANSGVNVALEEGATPFDSGNGMYYNEDNQEETTKALNCINDGDLFTGWQFNLYGEEHAEEHMHYAENELYVGYFFDEVQTINEIQIYWEDDTRALASTAGYTVTYTTSRDNPKWKKFSDIEYEYGEAEEFSTVAATINRSCDVITFEDTDVMGIRVMILETSNDKFCPQIYEIEAYKAESALTSEEVSEIYHFESDDVSSVETSSTVASVISTTPLEEESISLIDVESEPKVENDSSSTAIILIAIGSAFLVAMLAMLALSIMKKGKNE